jgi:hypothetical protein
MRGDILAVAGSEMAARPGTPTTRPAAPLRPARALPADRRQCRTADAGCTADHRPGRARLRASSASGRLARNTVAILRHRSQPDRLRDRPSARFASCLDLPPRPKTTCSTQWLGCDEQGRARQSPRAVQRHRDIKLGNKERRSEDRPSSPLYPCCLEARLGRRPAAISAFCHLPTFSGL